MNPVNDNKPRLALRPALPADTPLLAEIYSAAIEELTGEDYTEAQRAAWMGAAEDHTAFGERLAGGLTLIATASGTPAGFASLRGNSEIDMLYVRPEAARQGVAGFLCDALEKLAAGRGAARLDVKASDTARPFFEGRGYEAVRRETVTLGGEWLGRTAMEKGLKGA